LVQRRVAILRHRTRRRVTRRRGAAHAASHAQRRNRREAPGAGTGAAERTAAVVTWQHPPQTDAGAAGAGWRRQNCRGNAPTVHRGAARARRGGQCAGRAQYL
jgi:hypothetical protein